MTCRAISRAFYTYLCEAVLSMITLVNLTLPINVHVVPPMHVIYLALIERIARQIYHMIRIPMTLGIIQLFMMAMTAIATTELTIACTMASNDYLMLELTTLRDATEILHQ